MYDFLKLILTGERYLTLKRLLKLITASSVAECILIVILLFTSNEAVPAAVCITFGALFVICGIISAVLTVMRNRLSGVMINEQIAADALATDEAGKARRKLAERYQAEFSRQLKVTAVLCVLPVIFFCLTAVLTVLVNVGAIASPSALPITIAVTAVVPVMTASVPSFKDFMKTARIYEACGAEIAVLKRNAGVDEKTIAKQSYKAQKTATRSQELFLCDAADREELRRVASRGGYGALWIVAILVATVVAFTALLESYDTVYVLVSWYCLIAVAFVVCVILAIWVEIRKRAIFKANAAKFTDSPADEMRRYLQSEFIKLQRRGNLLFSLICGISTVVGFVLGTAGAFIDPDISLVENLSGCTAFFFFASAVTALIIWTIVYTCYRRKVKPVELKLTEIAQDK